MALDTDIVELDKVNVIHLKHLGLNLQAIEDKIIVLVDQYKTGYECKECGGTGKIKSAVVRDADRTCDACGGKGALLIIPQNVQALPSTGYVVSMGPLTPYMKLKAEIKEMKRDPSEDEFTLLDIKEREDDLKEIPVQLGSRIVFGPHVGTYLPMKGNVRLKIMRVHEPLCIIFGKNLDDKDFIDYETQSF